MDGTVRVDLQAIIERVKLGDKPAFAHVVDQFKRPLFGYLGRMGLTRAAAEDVAQEAFLKAWRNLHRFDAGRASFSTWLFTIARNHAINERARPSHRREMAENEDVLNVASAAPSAPDVMIATQARHALQQALAQLRPEDQRALALAYVEDLSMAEAATIESCSAGTFKTRLHRARERLRHILENDHET